MGREQNGEASSSGLYTYEHNCNKRVDIHEIFVKKSRSRVLLSYVGTVFLLANVCRLLLVKESLSLRGRVDRRFIPIGKILKPLLNECVTPVTCYWSLALLLRNEEELMLVFQKFRPPVKMLVPIWKALCSLTDAERSSPCAVSKPKRSET